MAKWTVKIHAVVAFEVEVEAMSEDEAYRIVDSKDTSFKREIVDKLNKDEYRTEILDIE